MPKHPIDCSHCDAVRESNSRRKLPEKERLRRRKESFREVNLRTRYGISIAQYEQLLVEQGGVCAICRKTCSTGKRLAVDHDHKSKKVRGLLCRKCNRGLGHFDDVSHLQNAITYLKGQSSAN